MALLPNVTVRIEDEVWDRSNGSVIKTVVRVPKGHTGAGTFLGVTNKTIERKVR